MRISYLFSPIQRALRDPPATDHPPLTRHLQYRHEVMQGQVHDGNAYVMGGIAGHAGLFGSVAAVAELPRRALAVLAGNESAAAGFLNRDTLERFVTAPDCGFSTRALGWDTNCGLPAATRSCGSMSPATFTHTGFTGTQICADPARGIFSLLFTNRVYPTRDNNAIRQVRRDFNSAVVSGFA